MAEFPFTDLHSFKDFVVFVRVFAPDRFPVREGLPVEDQWNLDLAFSGLREGIALAIREKGEREEFMESARLIESAYAHYKAGNRKGGFFDLAAAHTVLRRVQSR